MHHGICHTPLDIPTPTSDIWWPSLETSSNLFTERWVGIPPVLTSSGGHQSGWYCILLECFLVTAHKRSLGQGRYFYICIVILFTREGEYLTRYPLPKQTPPPGTRYIPPGPGTPPRSRHPPRADTPPRTRYTPLEQTHPRDQVHPPGPSTPSQEQIPPPRADTPSGIRYTPQDQVHPPPRSRACW